ncbi:hypothetical protein SEVIR_1G363666v4 [Setaria viridis]
MRRRRSQRKRKGEAPALRVLGAKATFYNCAVDAGQGALYDQMGLHYFKACDQASQSWQLHWRGQGSRLLPFGPPLQRRK